MLRKYLFLTFSAVLCFGVAARAVTTPDLIPAGTLLHCTMDEPNFSAKTAQIGDPVLCHLGPLGTFGHSVFPRGAELGGHLQDFKKPGHFWGKGSITIEFDRMILPGAQVLPLNAKVISAPHNKVDNQGDIKGKGHPTRDAVLWAIPLFWPVKVITLPQRGPYPTLKGETRLSLRLMEDVEVPFAVAKNGVPMPDYRPSNYRGSLQSRRQPTSASNYQPTSAVQRDTPVVRQTAYSQQPRASVYEGQVTIIALQAGAAVLATRYWIDGSDLHCVTQDGAEQNVPLALVDLQETVKVNQERNVGFTLRSRPLSKPAAVEQ